MLKQHSSEKDWEDVWNNSIKEHSLSEIISLKEETEKVIEACYDEHTVIAYSGGKDSLVLRHLAENCLDEPRFISCKLQNEFPSFEEWLERTAPKNTAWVSSDKLNLDFINENPEYLFPVDKKEQDFYVQVWRQPVHGWMRENGIFKIMTGKRGSDGNNCGSKNEFGCKTTEIKHPHIISLNPIADWTHEQLIAYIRYFKIELPKIYSYPNGFRFGTHPWTERRRLNGRYVDTFDEIMTLEPSVILSARDKVDLVDKYLKGELDY